MYSTNNLPPNLANFIAENTVSDQPYGLLYPLQDKTPLVIGLISTIQPKILSLVKNELEGLYASEFPKIWQIKPTWELSPMLKFGLRLLSIPTGGHILPMIYENALSIAISTKAEDGDVGGVLKGATAPLLSLTGKMKFTEWENLVFAQNTPDETLDVVLMYLRSIFPLGSDRYREYSTKIIRLFNIEPPEFQGTREGSPTGPQKNPSKTASRNKSMQYSQTYDDDLEEVPDDDPRQKDFKKASEAYEKELNPNYKVSEENTILYYEPFRFAQFVNPTLSSIGIPRWIEIAAILVSLDTLPSPLREQATAVLMLGICVGWTTQLKNAVVITDNATELQDNILGIYLDG